MKFTVVIIFVIIAVLTGCVIGSGRLNVLSENENQVDGSLIELMEKSQ